MEVEGGTRIEYLLLRKLVELDMDGKGNGGEIAFDRLMEVEPIKRGGRGKGPQSKGDEGAPPIGIGDEVQDNHMVLPRAFP